MAHDVGERLLHDAIERHTDLYRPVREAPLLLKLNGEVCMSGALRHQALYGHQAEPSLVFAPLMHSRAHLSHRSARDLKHVWHSFCRSLGIVRKHDLKRLELYDQ